MLLTIIFQSGKEADSAKGVVQSTGHRRGGGFKSFRVYLCRKHKANRLDKPYEPRQESQSSDDMHPPAHIRL